MTLSRRFRLSPTVTVMLVFLLCMTVTGWQILAENGKLRPVARNLYRRWKAARAGTQIDEEAQRLRQATVAIEVDPSRRQHPISPLIYGVAHAPSDPAVLRRLGVGLHRWGGNANTRHNWVANAWNSARDWQWRNSGSPRPPGAVADDFVRANFAAGVATMLTVPAIGWVAKNRDKESRSLNVPAAGGPGLSGPDGAIAGYDPTANRTRTSVPSSARKGAAFEDPPTRRDSVFQDEWIYHLTRRFGKASEGGVRFYAVDNEPDLWSSTHTDIHPAQMGYDDILKTFLEYATAIKDVDPTAQVTGPVTWGWTGYLYSALDTGTDNFHTHADRRRHGDEPFLLWFLKRVRAHDEAQRRRTLDVLDIHYYPQSGIYSAQADPAMRARRLRSTRSLWDSTYSDESWIGEAVRLIPRMKEWIAVGYPGTLLGILEWNFGAEDDISGGLATAEALGIFGREGVDLASYWTTPKAGSFSELAFRLYRNADGKGVAFGDVSCQATSAASGRVSCFAGIDSRNRNLTLMLINKMPFATAIVPVRVTGWASTRPARLWQIDAQHPQEIRTSIGPTLASEKATFSLQPYSATLVRFTPEGI